MCARTLLLCFAINLSNAAAPAQTLVSNGQSGFRSTANVEKAVLTEALVNPASCANPGAAPTWCYGSTADAWIRAACNQLPPGGGIVDLTGLGASTQTLAGSISGCSSPTKQITFVFDTATTFLVTESDGGIVFPLDNASAAVGLGAGQCNNSAGIHLTASSNITAIFGAAHTDGTQENLAIKGICAFGASGATVTKGLIYIKNLATNTTIEENNLSECNTSCIWLENPAGHIQISDNWLNVTDGNSDIVGSGLVIYGSGGGGIRGSSVSVVGNTIEHSNGAGQHEVDVTTSGDGSILCGISLHDDYSERNYGPGVTPSLASIHLQDCWNCSLKDYNIWGGTSSGNDAVNVGQSAGGRTQNVSLQNIWVGVGSFVNIINDTINNVAITAAANPFGVTSYVINPGFYGSNNNPVSATPSVTLSPAETLITTSEALSVGVSVNGTPTPTGTITVASANYLSSATLLTGGAANITIPAGALQTGTDTITATYSGSTLYNSATGVATVTVAPDQPNMPGFTAGSDWTPNISVAAGATTGNTGIVSIVGTNGFSGTVKLACSISIASGQAIQMPTCSLTPGSLNILGTSAQNSQLTINTTQALAGQDKGKLVNLAASGSGFLLACLVGSFLRRRIVTLLKWLVVFVIVIGASGCAGGKLHDVTSQATPQPGTTRGNYVVTITGSSGQLSAQVGTVTLTVL